MTLQATHPCVMNLEFQDLPIDCFESWKFAESNDVSTRKLLEPEKNQIADEFPQIKRLSQDELQDWLYQKGKHKTSCPLDGSKVISGLRLIILKLERATRPVIPFTKDNFKLISDTMSIPQSYFYEMCAGLYPVAYRSQQTRNPNGTGVAIMCQSPTISSTRTSLALSYDPSSNITTGVLIYADGDDFAVHPLISRVLTTVHKFPHPMLLPVLVLEYWSYSFEGGVGYGRETLIGTQITTGLLEQEMKKWHGEDLLLSKTAFEDRQGNFKKKSLNDAHRSLALVHTCLMNPTSTFVIDLAASLLRGLEEIKNLSHSAGRRQIIEDCGEELREYVLQMQNCVEYLLEEKQILLSQADFQLKVLYNIMQQTNNDNNFQIAMENKRDSRAVKTISIVTMVFLPGTAIATIFSMSPFFPSSPKFTVSTQFWIYWAVVIPLTAAVLLTWRYWMARGEKKDVEGGWKLD